MLGKLITVLARRLKSNNALDKQYFRAGVKFADAVSYLGHGECIGFRGMLAKWEVAEQEYARRGYRTICLDDFFEGLNGHDLKEKRLVKRDQGEAPVFYATIYRSEFLGKVAPAVDLNKLLTGEVGFVSGTWNMPSIPDLSKKENQN